MTPYDNQAILWPDTPFDLQSHLILAGKRGSEAHGTYIPHTAEEGIDDKDIMGFVVQPPSGYIGLKEWDGADSIKDVWDVVLYDIRKAVRLLSGMNPNIISMLWLREEDYIKVTRQGRMLIDNRGLFVARKAFYDSFCGYARGQLHRMMHPEKGDPKRGFMGEKRKKLVEKFGYDCKNAQHCIRLLHVGKEFLETGSLQVFRTWDADMLKAIKTGKWEKQQVIDYTENMFSQVEQAYNKSKIQESVDLQKIEEVLESVVMSFWEEKGYLKHVNR
jgi:uncharacterized protein